MTGPEHYHEAEQLANAADVAIGQYEEDGCAAKRDIAAVLGVVAQVHATLALAAATALGRAGEGGTQPPKDRAAWFDAAAECRKQAQS